MPNSQPEQNNLLWSVHFVEAVWLVSVWVLLFPFYSWKGFWWWSLQPSVWGQWDQMKEQIAWPSLEADNCKPCPPPITRRPNPCSETAKHANGEGPLKTTTPLLIQSTVWQDMGRPLYSGCEQDTAASESTRSELTSWTLHSAMAKKRNRRSTTSSRAVPSGGNRNASHGWVDHQQTVGNGRRPSPHHPVSGNMWTEGLSTADRSKKKKWDQIGLKPHCFCGTRITL